MVVLQSGHLWILDMSVKNIDSSKHKEIASTKPVVWEYLIIQCMESAGVACC